MKVVGYVRVSTEEQELGVEVQKQAIENFCKARNWELVKFFEDVGVSGAEPVLEREGFKQAIEYCKLNGINVIVVYSIDRFGRSFYNIFETLRRLEFEFNIKVVSVREEFLQSQDPLIRTLILSVLSWVAWYERYLIRERTRRALQAKGVKHSVEISEDKVKTIVDLYTKLGYSVRRIAKVLNISERQVRKVLVNVGLIQLPPNICPRCFSKMIPDDQYEGMMYCKNCGYLKPRV